MEKSFFLVEDHSLMRQGIVAFLSKLPEFRCAGMAGTAQEFLDVVAQPAGGLLPDVLVTDLNISGSMGGGISLIRQCRTNYPSIKIVVYSMYIAASVVSSALKAGADAYVSKLSNEEELGTALREVLAGRSYIDSAVSSQMLAYERSLSLFSRKEQEILNLVLHGKNNAGIAEALNLKKRSVENYLSRIYDKTGFSSKEELVEHYGYIQ